MNQPIKSYPLAELKNAAIYMFTQNKFQELFEITCTALARDDADHIIKVMFAQAVAQISIVKDNTQVKNALLKTLEEDGIEYQKLCRAWMMSIVLDPFFYPFFQIGDHDEISDSQWTALQEVLSSRLLLEGIKKILLEKEEFETVLVKLRRLTLMKLFPSGRLKTKHLSYICAIAEQCYHNEYAYYIEDDEKAALSTLSKTDPISVAILACYESLYKHNIPLKISPIVPLKRVLEIQVRNQQREQEIKASLSKIGMIEDDISQGVQAMYEENPYPRWRHIDITDPRKGNRGNILIAGCGTGRFLMQLACQLQNMKFTAIDISSSSIAYAQRVSEDYGVKNVEFIQCDILNLHELPKTYDFINCSGVLHHMKDPIAGWKKLIEKLNPGGMMLIGLYSTKARTVIEDAHTFIKEKEYGPNIDDIRRFRRDIIALPADHNLKRLMTFKDFFSSSDIRDLVFHIQEKTYDIPELRDTLEQLDLEFMGFKIRMHKITSMYKEAFPEDTSMLNLDNWNNLENQEPRMFGEMYNFWCRRKGDQASNPAMQEIFTIGI